MKKIKIACGTLLLAALLGWNCPVWAAEPAALAAEAQQSAFMAAYEAFLDLCDIQDTRYRFY